MSRIAATFERLRARGETALMPYLSVGYPERGATAALGAELVRSGADGLELGIPFSDPLADGATLQRVNHQTLRQGITLDDALTTARELRATVEVPLVFMSYYNPIQRRGIERFSAAASEAGADGVIVPDLPIEEAEPLRAACAGYGLSLVTMVAPTTPEDRLAAACRLAQGFIYCVALVGVTGARSNVGTDLPSFLQRVRRHTDLPLVVGFGISRPEHVATVGRHADGAIVASALVDLLDTVPPKERLSAAGRYVRELKEACRIQTGVPHGP